MIKEIYNKMLKDNEIKDAYPRILIANTKHDTYSYEGVHIINIGNWLMDEE